MQQKICPKKRTATQPTLKAVTPRFWLPAVDSFFDDSKRTENRLGSDWQWTASGMIFHSDGQLLKMQPLAVRNDLQHGGKCWTASLFSLRRREKLKAQNVNFMSIELSVCRSVNPSICRSVDLSIYRPIDLSIRRSIDLSNYRSIDPSIYRSIELSICRTIDLSIYLSIYGSIDMSIYGSMDLSIDRSILSNLI